MQHVSVNDGGQAIVGNVTHRPASEQPATAGAIGAALPMPDSPRCRLWMEPKGEVIAYEAPAKMDDGQSSARNTGPMLASRALRGQHTFGQPLHVAGGQRQKPLPDARRCAAGAPRGNKNALKHGRFTREAIAERRLVRSLLQESRALIAEDPIVAARSRRLASGRAQAPGLFAVSLAQSVRPARHRSRR